MSSVRVRPILLVHLLLSRFCGSTINKPLTCATYLAVKVLGLYPTVIFGIARFDSSVAYQICDSSSNGRAPALQAGCCGFEPRLSLQRGNVTSVVVAPRIALDSLIGALQQAMTKRLTRKEMECLAPYGLLAQLVRASGS